MELKENCTSSVISAASLFAPELGIYSILQDGKTIHVLDADLIQIISEIFRVPYKILTPPDGEVGKRLPDGNWTGMIGMVNRSEVDLAVGCVAINEERFQAVKFSTPHSFSEFSFMTDMLKPLSAEWTLFHPFSLKLWILIIAAVFFVSLFLYIMSDRRQTYGKVLFLMFGSFMEKGIHFKNQKIKLGILVSTWLFFAFVITNSYKAHLLSCLSVPTLTGIRNFQDLAKAAENDAITCYTHKGGILSSMLLESEFDSWRSIGKCLGRNIDSFGEPHEKFLMAPPKKVFLTAKIYLIPYEKVFFISEDSFSSAMAALAVSRNFSCQKQLNNAMQRLFEVGVFSKLLQDEYLHLESHRQQSNETEMTYNKTLRWADLQGAFFILVYGYTLALMTLLIEIFIKYIHR